MTLILKWKHKIRCSRVRVYISKHDIHDKVWRVTISYPQDMNWKQYTVICTKIIFYFTKHNSMTSILSSFSWCQPWASIPQSHHGKSWIALLMSTPDSCIFFVCDIQHHGLEVEWSSSTPTRSEPPSSELRTEIKIEKENTIKLNLKDSPVVYVPLILEKCLPEAQPPATGNFTRRLSSELRREMGLKPNNPRSSSLVTG